MKAKKLIMALLGAVLLLSLVATPALADPPSFQPDPNPPPWTSEKNLVTDPLAPPPGSPQPGASGYVRFLCETQQGFEYSIGVHDLTKGKYTVEAFSLGVSDGGGVTYPLGTINVKPSGDGEVEGIVSLPLPGHFLIEIFPGVYVYLYEWEIRVKDSTGAIVLATFPIDPAGFAVFP